MSRRSKSHRGPDHGGRHVRLYHWIMETAAWKSLSPVSRSLYVEMAARYMGSNNGRMPYSLREGAEALRVGRTTAWQAFKQLQERGFIVPHQVGSFSWKNRHATTWRLTEFGCNITGDLATKDFAKWSPEGKVRVLRANRTGPESEPFGSPGRTIVLEKAVTGPEGEP